MAAARRRPLARLGDPAARIKGRGGTIGPAGPTAGTVPAAGHRPHRLSGRANPPLAPVIAPGGGRRRPHPRGTRATPSVPLQFRLAGEVVPTGPRVRFAPPRARSHV